MLKSIKNVIGNVLKVIITIVLIILVLLTFTNVVTRNLFKYSIHWAEELSRALFVWAIFLGISLSMLESSLMSITLVTDLIKKRNNELLVNLIYWIASLIFFGVVAVCGVQYAKVGNNAISNMLKVHLSVIYAAIPYCGFSSCLFTIMNIIIYFQEKRG